MRKYIPIVAAMAVVVLLGAAILASGEALSFSVPGAGDSVVERAPVDQAEPQDFAGAGSQFYYFGPDFMCQIYANTTIGCFGSNANNVISNVPRETGFTNIDGGETYACAFHQATRFNYCWGSINLRPSTTQPTATATPEATATPTATVDPNETPEPTATVDPAATATVTATATAVPNPCRINLPSSGSLPITVTGSWIEECIYPLEIEDVAAGDRYYRFVAFSATSAVGTWTATLSSATADTYMLLSEWDSALESYVVIDENDDIQSGNTNSRITWTPVQDQFYLLDLTTYTAETLGDFSLTIESDTGSGQGQSSAGEQNIGQSAQVDSMPLDRRQ